MAGVITERARWPQAATLLGLGVCETRAPPGRASGPRRDVVDAYGQAPASPRLDTDALQRNKMGRRSRERPVRGARKQPRRSSQPRRNAEPRRGRRQFLELFVISSGNEDRAGPLWAHRHSAEHPRMLELRSV